VILGDAALVSQPGTVGLDTDVFGKHAAALDAAEETEMVARYDWELVRAALTPRAVLNHLGLKFRDAGKHHILNLCFQCGQATSDPFKVHIQTGLFCCFKCSVKGDLLALLAGFLAMDTRADFVQLVQVAAGIANVDPCVDVEERERQLQAAREREAARRIEWEAERARQRQDARTHAANQWRMLQNNAPRAGTEYLRRRGLDPSFLVENRYVHFYANGDIAVELFDLEDGELVNVVRRVLAPVGDQPKVLGLKGCPNSGTLVGRKQEIAARSIVMLTEGVFDSLTAISLWPDRVVAGAHGASCMPAIAESLAPRILQTGAQLWLVPHDDETGRACAGKAIEAAKRCGLVGGRSLFVLKLSDHKDLNAARMAGWRP
jgi:hypothetical protein